MLTKRFRLAATSLALTALLAGSSLADIVIITVGEKTGKYLDSKVVEDGNPLTTIQIIKVPGL